MLIQLTKKIKSFYKVKPEDIPSAVFSEQGMKDKLYMQFYLYKSDYAANLNVRVELINTDHVKRFSIFDYQDEYRNAQGDEYLIGANTKVIFNDNSTIFVTETISQIASLTGALK